MNFSTICFMFLGLLLISQYPFAANASARSHGLLKESPICKVCNYSSNMAECNKILRSNPKAVQAKTQPELAKVVLEMAICKASEVQTFLKQLAAKIKCPTLTKCANTHYKHVVRSFKMAQYVLKKDPLYATSASKAADDGIYRCEKEMAVAHVVNPQVTALNYQIGFYSDLAYLATDYESEYQDMP